MTEPAPLLTRAAVLRLLDVHGLAPRRSAGQHFVVDPNTVRKAVRDAGVKPDALVCEIGPGLGSLTLALREAGATVVAIEVDGGLVRALRQVVADDEGVRIVHADALATDLAALLGSAPALLVANLPYHAATPLLLHALAANAFTGLFVMVQREVGERWVADVGDERYGAVSVKIRAQASARIAARVSRAAFYPVPGVDSVTVSLTPRPWRAPVARARLFGLVEAGFSQRRKRLRNALSSARRPPPAVEAALRRAGLSAAARAEELDLTAWIALTEVFCDATEPASG